MCMFYLEICKTCLKAAKRKATLKYNIFQQKKKSNINMFSLKMIVRGMRFWNSFLEHSLVEWEGGKKQLIVKMKLGVFMIQSCDMVPWHNQVLGTMPFTIFVAVWDADPLKLLSNTFWHDYGSWPLWIWMAHCQTKPQVSVNIFHMNVTRLNIHNLAKLSEGSNNESPYFHSVNKSLMLQDIKFKYLYEVISLPSQLRHDN